MKVHKEQIIVPMSFADLTVFFSDMANYAQLMPDNTKKFYVYDENKGFKVGVGSMPEVGMKLEEMEEGKLRFISPSDQFDYDLNISYKAKDESTSVVDFTFNGNFNPMIAMMANGPLTHFFESFAEKLASLNG